MSADAGAALLFLYPRATLIPHARWSTVMVSEGWLFTIGIIAIGILSAGLAIWAIFSI